MALFPTSVRRAGALLGVILLFGVPFALREANPGLEPYPAFLLPAGNGRLGVADGSVAFERIELFSVGPDGSASQLSPSEFVAPVPVQYWPTIARRGFGLIGAKRPPAEVLQTVEWLRDRLAAAGRDTDTALRVRSVALRVDTRTGRKLDEKITWSFDVLVR